MGQTLLLSVRKKIITCIFFSLLIALGAGTISAQTVLAPGDLFFVTINSGSTDYFEFIPLVDIEAGTTINFTNDIWINSESSFKDSETSLTYIAPAEVTAGTVISFTGSGEKGFVKRGDFKIQSSKENILVYQGEKTNPQFIYGIGWSAESDAWSYDATPSEASNIPPVLSEEDGTVLSLASADYQQYDPGNGIEGSKKDLMDILANSANWTRNENRFSELQTRFRLSEPVSPKVIFKTSSGTVDKNDGSFNLTVELVESIDTAVEVEVSFVSSLSSVSSSDIGDFKNQIVSFSSEAESGDTKTVTIPLGDDISEDDTAAVFRLQNISEGAVAEPEILVLNIGDNEPSGVSFQIGGSEGWRMITIPSQNMTFEEVFGKFRIQGVRGSDDPSAPANIYRWDEISGEGNLEIPSSMSEAMDPGKGYLIYFFEDDDTSLQGIQGGFPKILNFEYTEANSSVRVNVSATDSNGNDQIDNDEGWNLLGNPFNVDISVTELLNTLESAGGEINRNLYVWDSEEGNGNGGFIPLTGNDIIAPFQAFFVRFTGEEEINESITLNKNTLAGNKYYEEVTENRFGFSMQLTDESGFDEFSLLFSDAGDVEAGTGDVFKLQSLNNSSVNFYGSIGTEKFQQKILPENLESSLEIPLNYEYKKDGDLTLTWSGIEDLPSDWTVTLIDRQQNTEINLKSNEEYTFANGGDFSSRRAGVIQEEEKLRINMIKETEEDSRFLLSIKPGTDKKAEDELPNTIKLNPNYPNPFNLTTNISYELTEQAEVSLTIWNMIGQKVTTLVEGSQEAGEHTEIWNANSMPSGMYIAQLEVGGRVYIRKMTLIK